MRTWPQDRKIAAFSLLAYPIKDRLGTHLGISREIKGDAPTIPEGVGVRQSYGHGGAVRALFSFGEGLPLRTQLLAKLLCVIQEEGILRLCRG